MKKAIVIGASSGIGEQLAELLYKANYEVAITGRREQLLKEIVTRFKDRMIYRAFDVKETALLENRLDKLTGVLGGCDLLIISAGTGDINDGLDYSIEKDIIETNVAAFTCAADWGFRYFQRQGTGHLVAISSVAGLRGFAAAPGYNASKAYQVSYLEALRQKAKKLKLPVYVTDIRPGFVNTKMAKGPGQFWVSSPVKATEQIFTAIRRKRKVVYVTKRWRLIGGLLKILPRFIHERI